MSRKIRIEFRWERHRCTTRAVSCGEHPRDGTEPQPHILWFPIESYISVNRSDDRNYAQNLPQLCRY